MRLPKKTASFFITGLFQINLRWYFPLLSEFMNIIFPLIKGIDNQEILIFENPTNKLLILYLEHTVYNKQTLICYSQLT